MDKKRKNHFIAAVIAMTTMGFVSGGALAGGFLDIDFDDSTTTTFTTPTVIDNPYWPLYPDGESRTFTYIGGTEDECVIDQVSVTGAFHLMTTTDVSSPYYLFTALEVEDTEWVFEDFEDCDLSLLPDPSAIKEQTRDWYAQDDNENIWYLGEKSQSYENFEDDDGNPVDCGPYPGPATPPDECFEGSWEAGKLGGEVPELDEDDERVLGQAGIVVPGDEPIAGELLTPGTYYFQEVAYEAEDMAKILKLKTSVSVDVEGASFNDNYENCRTVKEWNPQEHGESVEHKIYCAGPGLVLIEGLGGGPTEVEELVSIVPPL